MCCLPVHQDGSCNGLQHYSALGGDPLGAKSVNVLPSDRPQDVYSDVCAMVEERVAKVCYHDDDFRLLCFVFTVCCHTRVFFNHFLF